MNDEKPGVSIKFSVFTDDGNGYIEVNGDDVLLTAPKHLKLKKSYLDSLNKGADLPMTKTQVTLAYYDLFGSRDELKFAMNAAEFRALKKILGK